MHFAVAANRRLADQWSSNGNDDDDFVTFNLLTDTTTHNRVPLVTAINYACLAKNTKKKL